MDYRLADGDRPSHRVLSNDGNHIVIEATSGLFGREKRTLKTSHYDFTVGAELSQHAYVYSITAVIESDKPIGKVDSINKNDNTMTILMGASTG